MLRTGKLLTLWSVVGVWALAAANCLAQAAIPAALERRGVLTTEKRASLAAELRKQSAPLEAQAAVVKTVAKLVGPSVVHVSAEAGARHSLQTGRRRPVEDSGSGVIWRSKDRNYVLTNRHVIHGAPIDGIRIEMEDGRTCSPTKVWEDPATDVAVMAIDVADAPAAALGNSAEVEIGDFVLAIGSPFGLRRSVTFGIISAKGRCDLRLDESGLRYQDFLQTDAAINPGNSGGPLLNLRGEVIGVNTAIASTSGKSEGVGFSIPINMFMAIARQLIEHGVVTPAFMGVNLEPAFNAAMASSLGLPRPLGAMVLSITPNSPAEKARLHARDVILEFNNTPVENESHLINLVRMTEVGSIVPLSIFREGKMVQAQIELADRNKHIPPQEE